MLQVKIDVLGQDVCTTIRLNRETISDDIEMFIKVTEVAVERILWNSLKSREETYKEEFYVEFNKMLVTIPKEFCIDWENDINKEVQTLTKEVTDKIALKTYRTILPLLKFE